MSHTCTPMFKSYLPLSMIFTIFSAPYFLPSRHPSSYVSTHQQHILPVQITGRRVVVRADKYCQDVLHQEHLGHVKGHKQWVCDDTRWPCCIHRLPLCRRVPIFETWFNPGLWYVFYPSCIQQDGHSWNYNEISWNVATSNFAHYYVCTRWRYF